MAATALAGVALAGVALAVPTGAARRPPTHAGPSGLAFYAPPKPLTSAEPGTLIWATPYDAKLSGTRAWRVLYHSRAVDGRDIAVSGVIVAPVGKAPAAGRPVISWAHGTQGIADKCAPSRSRSYMSQHPAMRDLIRRGYVVVATDYEGLGTPGVHPYLVGESEGRGVLDIVRAAHQVQQAGASSHVLVYGQSQGGQAALFAGELAPTYAPDLDVLGVVALAPVTEVNAMLPAAAMIPETLGFVVMGVIGLHAAYPDAKVSDVFTPAALTQSSVVQNKCADGVLKTFQEPVAKVIANNPADVAPFPQIMQRDTAGLVKTSAPLLVLQGLADDIVYKTFTDMYVKRVCAIGDTVEYRTFSGVDHYGGVKASKLDVLSWIDQRLAGDAAPSTCVAGSN